MTQTLPPELDLPPGERRALLERLLRARVDGPARPAEAPPSDHPYAEYVNPYLAAVLRAFNLDKRYVRGEGCWIHDDQGRKYLDFTAAYGALPFGFNPPEIWDAVGRFATERRPSLAQPSFLEDAGELARRLVEIAPPGLRYVTFANSGAEANEVAIKLARAATGRLGIVSTDNGFHGKTLGALSATGRPLYQQAFGAPAPGFQTVPFGDLRALESALAAEPVPAAFIVEPIQGEGGIVVPPVGYLRGARDLCRRHGVLMVCDEVQTGLGRTGRLFACEEEGVAPDILTLAKALGGGVVPIAAVICTEDSYSEEFALKHTSTFAANGLACCVAIQTLDLLARDEGSLVRRVAECGRYLGHGLEALQRRYPQLIRSVRGRGYLQGIELSGDHAAFDRQSLLASMATQETLAIAVCSYLLNVEGVRLAPTLFGGRVLRVEPALVAAEPECDAFLAAMDRTCAALAAGDSARLLGHLVGVDAPAPAERGRRRVPVPAPRAGEARWAFIAHPLDDRSYRDFDATLAHFSDAQLKDLAGRLSGARNRLVAGCLVMGAGRLRSATGAEAFGEILSVPYTADELLALPTAEAVAQIREAVAHAADRGARVVGLGAYTSVVTRNGRDLDDLGVPVTTGNSYTVASALEAVAYAEAALELGPARIGVVGASGSIGGAVAAALGERAGSLILIGNPAHPQTSVERLRHVAREVVRSLIASPAGRRRAGTLGERVAQLFPRTRPSGALDIGPALAQLQTEGRLVVATGGGRDLRGADIVVTATSSTARILGPDDLGPGTVVCDVSRPSNVSPELAAARPDVLVVDGGLVAMPEGQDLGIDFGLEPGLLYACMAETVLLALAQRYGDGTVGATLSAAFIEDVRGLARHHGFAMAPPSTGGRVLQPADWRRVADARAERSTPALAREAAPWP